MSDTRPPLSTPTGGAMSRPEHPKQWHGYPYVWAWHVCGGSLSHDYIEARCKEAAEAGAPPDAAYYTGPNVNPPNTWMTVDQLSDRYHDRVKNYGNALLKWEQDLAAYRQTPAVQPLSQAQPLPQEQPAPAPAVPVPDEGRGMRLATRQPHQH